MPSGVFIYMFTCLSHVHRLPVSRAGPLVTVAQHPAWKLLKVIQGGLAQASRSHGLSLLEYTFSSLQAVHDYFPHCYVNKIFSNLLSPFLDPCCNLGAAEGGRKGGLGQAANDYASSLT